MDIGGLLMDLWTLDVWSRGYCTLKRGPNSEWHEQTKTQKVKKSKKNQSSIEFLGIDVSNARKCEHDPSCIDVDLTVLHQFSDDELQIPVQRTLTIQINDPL
jgi:hypothetical protein